MDYEHLSKEDLIEILKRRDAKTSYGLTWERNEIEHDKALNDDFVAMNLMQELSIGQAPYQNLLIEGDNFDALRYLRMTYKNKVRVIYIDPPYNTGNQDFIYNDRFLDKNDNWKHSKWLEFMYRRMILARELLTDDGVLLVSINDENRAKLELLLDSVFPGRRTGSFVWRTKDTGNDAGGNLSQVHEHVLIYSNPAFGFNGKKLDLSKYRYKDKDGRLFSTDPLTKAHDYKVRRNTYYPIQDPNTGYWYPCDPERVWAYATEKNIKTKLRKDTIEDMIKQELVYFPECKKSDVMQWDTLESLIEAIRNNKGPISPKKKTPLLREDLPDLEFWVGKPIAPGRPSKKSYLDKKTKMIAPVSSWIAGLNEDIDYIYDEDSEEMDTMRSARGGEGTDTINEILGYKAFSFPKPPSLIRNLVKQSTKENDIVLDFFAGSGTTAQAVLELNKEDGLNRKFILVSSPEMTKDIPPRNICRDVCAKRIQGVIEGYRNVEGRGGNFAYLTMVKIPIEHLGMRVQHEQVWLALQLINDCSIYPYSSDNLQIGKSYDKTIIYIPELNKDVIDQIQMTVSGCSGAIIYSWEPGIIRRQIEHPAVTIEKIPDFLVQCFGGN